MTAGLGSSLTSSLKSNKSTEVAATIGDAAIEAALKSEGLDSIPILGIVRGLWRVGNDVKHELFIRKVMRFLAEAGKASSEERRQFTEQLESEGKDEEFGETILLILDRLDDTVKPAMVGRVMAAHMRGEVDYARSMRLCSIIARSYIGDLEYLKSFKGGAQREMTSIAESLFAAGVLSNAGFDGGDAGDPLSGGVIYRMNEYGELLVRFALDDVR